MYIMQSKTSAQKQLYATHSYIAKLQQATILYTLLI